MKYIVLVSGTRPQLIKAVPFIRELKTRSGFDFIHVFTDQHYSNGLTEVFYKEWEIIRPNIHLTVGSGTVGDQISSIVSSLGSVLVSVRPDLIVVAGDTTSALASALAGYSLKIPVHHIEAGPRMNTNNLEEKNRRMIDHCSSVLYAPTETCKQNLIREKVLGKVILSGDIMYDLFLQEKVPSRDFTKPSVDDYILLTLHRRENISNETYLLQLMEELSKVRFQVLFPVHPHTKKMVELHDINFPVNVIAIPPQNYHSFLNLIQHSGLVLTDSGGAQKESFFAKKSSIYLYETPAWPETVMAGSSTVRSSLEGLNELCEEKFNKEPEEHPSNYFGSGNSAKMIVDYVLDGDY